MFGQINKKADKTVLVICALALLASALLPWYMIDEGFWSTGWLKGYPTSEISAPLLLILYFQGKSLWLIPILGLLISALLCGLFVFSRPVLGKLLVFIGVTGVVYMLLQGFAFGLQGWSWQWLSDILGQTQQRQLGMGYGAFVCGVAFLFLFTHGTALLGAVRGDSFISGSIGLIVALISLFVGFPIVKMLFAAFYNNDGGFSVQLLFERLIESKNWRLSCLTGGTSCGVAWNSLFMGVIVGVGTTVLGLAFALIITRTKMPLRKIFKSLSLLPIVTPPFVVGLAMILLFGAAGSVTQFVADLFNLQQTRWIYGFWGVAIAQILAYTPIAFLVIIGVVESISPSMEEAAQTLFADRWQTFKTVTWPLMRPGLANAFLLGFIESLADFGNPMVLGGNHGFLSTEIFFSIAGSQHDLGRASVLSMILLFFTLGAFIIQQRWVGIKSYTTITGKGDGGISPPLPKRVSYPCYTVALLWTLLTVVIYGMIVYGSFVNLWGRDHTLTFRHYLEAFNIAWTDRGIYWQGSAWSSLFTTIEIALVSAPLTAGIGLVTAWLLARQTFWGKNLFEFGNMLSFAIPGTVVGISYIVAFNVPPVEITGTALILVICFVFRNMPVGVRSGIAALSQIDKSLDEASLMLGANSLKTFHKITLPLLRPAILSALVYSFVRAMTAISAIIFLVSANYDMATSYIIGRVDNNEYGLAIAYSTVLIFIMLFAILIFQYLVKGRRLVGQVSVN